MKKRRDVVYVQGPKPSGSVNEAGHQRNCSDNDIPNPPEAGAV